MLIGKSLVSVCVASAVVLGVPAAAQEAQPQRMQNVTYHGVEFIKFKEGSRERAGEIVEQYFAPASRDASTTMPLEYHIDTGEWDYIMFWPMKGGMADMEWETHPEEIAWMQALTKRAGGDTQAKALLDEWNGLVARRVNGVAHSHNPAN